MRKTVLHWLGHSLVIVAAAALTACTRDTPLTPDVPAVALRTADLGSCQKLQAPAGSTLYFHVYAEGFQIYRWNGTSWTFVEPSAVLYANEEFTGEVGTHFAGPTWQSNSGSKVVGAVIDRCTPDTNSIPWLSLNAVSIQGPGIFENTTFLQRLNTVGGNAPSTPGGAIGDVAKVPYTAEYAFYR